MSTVFVGLRAVSRGLTLPEAAAVAGVSVNTLWRRVSEQSVPVLRDRTPRVNALTLEEREEIRVGIEKGLTDSQTSEP